MGFMDKWTGKIGGWLYNATGAAQQWANQKEAMQNAHQWEVADLRKAGLNPILSAGGTGASTGGASGGTPVADVNPLSYMNSAIGALQTLKNLDVMDANIKKAEAETTTTENQGRYFTALEKQAMADAAWKNISTALGAMDYEYWKSNRDKYEVRMSGKAFPNYGLGAGAEVFAQLFRGLFSGNSAKDLRHYRFEDSR